MNKDYKLLGEESDLGVIHWALLNWKARFVTFINRGGVCDAEAKISVSYLIPDSC